MQPEIGKPPVYGRYARQWSYCAFALAALSLLAATAHLAPAQATRPGALARLVFSITTGSTGAGAVASVSAMAVSAQCELLVFDSRTSRVVIYGPEGRFLKA